MNPLEHHHYLINQLRQEQERERAAENSNQAPVSPADSNAKESADATAIGIEFFEKIRDAVYERNQDTLKPDASVLRKD
jgi:hypothetical protein